MDFLKHIDFDHDDGVYLPMINDFLRNQFYDRVLSKYVAGQICTDIGFGTGLLTVLALKHGAQKIRAFESDVYRYQLGLEIINRLHINNRVDLINERYDHTVTPTSITFTETVNTNLWGESLYRSLPLTKDQIFLPGEYFLEIWAVEISNNFAQGLLRTEKRNAHWNVYADVFSPGIDLDQEFINLISEISNKKALITTDLTTGINKFDLHIESDWGYHTYLKAVQTGSVVAGYSVSKYDPDIREIILTVPTHAWSNSNVLIVPRVGMRQGTDCLYLDTGNWGPCDSPIILVKPAGDLSITHNLRNGSIDYNLL